MAKKYISKVRKNGQDLYIKDKEARESLVIYNDVYYGRGSSVSDILNSSHHHDTVRRGDSIYFMSLSSVYLWIVYPLGKMGPSFTLNGMFIPEDREENITIEGVTYVVFKSSNTYNGSFGVKVW